MSTQAHFIQFTHRLCKGMQQTQASLACCFALPSAFNIFQLISLIYRWMSASQLLK